MELQVLVVYLLVDTSGLADLPSGQWTDTNIHANRHGAQGPFNGAPKGILESEFGTSVDEDVITQILEKGSLQEGRVRTTFFLP